MSPVTPLLRWAPPAGELHDVQLHVRMLGEGRPTFLLLHGLAGSQRYFGAAFDALGAEGRLVVPDLLGFGASLDRPGGDYGADAHAEAVIASLEELHAEPPIYIGAHSVGSIVALRMAARWPERIRGIAMFGPPLYRTRVEARAHIAQLGLWARLFALDTLWARSVCTWMCRHRSAAARIAEWIRPDLPAPIARDGVRHTWNSYRGSLRNLVLNSDAALDLERVHAPILILCGSADRVVERSYLSELASRENVELEVWPDGHDLPLVDPERCSAAVRSLVRRVEPDVPSRAAP